jgi:O-acetyl-ADP-ribose deacetylase (regulator of RNase III)
VNRTPHPLSFTFPDKSLTLHIGDITSDDSDAIVNPVTSFRAGGGLVDLAVCRVAGPALRAARERMGTSLPDDATGPVLTPGFDLPCRCVVHVVPPNFSRDRAATLRLEACYEEALESARARGLTSIAFPSLGTGSLGYPLHEAAPIALRALTRGARRGAPVRIRLVLFGPATFDVYLAAAEALLSRERWAARAPLALP